MVHVTDFTEDEQEVLEKLWQHQQEGWEFPAGVEEEVDRLKLRGKGWIEQDSLKLTQEGLKMAGKAIRRHRLAERLLADLMGTDQMNVEEHACILEHSLKAGLAEKVCTFLGHPTVCPHGNPIPEGECCRAAKRSVDAVIVRLSNLEDNEEGEIAYLSTPGGDDLQKFLSMGIHPGDSITLVRKTPTVVFRCGNSRFAVDRDLASQIYVRRSGSTSAKKNPRRRRWRGAKSS